MLDCSLIFFCSGFKESSFKISDMGLDLLRLFGSCGKRVKFCKAAAVTALLGDVGKRGSPVGTPVTPGIPGNLGNGCGMPGKIIPGGRNGFGDNRRECAVVVWGEEVGVGRPGKPGRPVRGCLIRAKGAPGNAARPGIGLLLAKAATGEGAVGAEVNVGIGGGVDFVGDEHGLGLLVAVIDVVTVDVTGLIEGVDTTRLKGPPGDPGSSDWGSPFKSAAKLLPISDGEACLLR
jgi:hypothetical protein